MRERKNAIVAQSGGPTPAINASLAGVAGRAMAAEEIGEVFGSLHGLQGILERQIISITDQINTASDLVHLIHTPAMALGSCRFRLPANNGEIFGRALQTVKDYDIGYFFYIGGNDSMDTASRLSAFFKAAGEDIKCIGVPKTIDNDLAETDHSPGFGSAARFIATSFAETMIDMSVYANPSVNIIEVMGRNSGWLTASAALARGNGLFGPHLIYLPEVPFDPAQFVADVERKLAEEKHVLIAVSEGVRLADGTYVAEANGGATDVFGHKALGGVGKALENLLRSHFSGGGEVKLRSVEPNVLQRVAMHLASGTDLREAQDVGAFAVEAALRGESDKMVAIRRVSNNPYLVRYELVPLASVANKEKTVPRNWVTKDGTDVTEEMLQYLRPLFRGEIHVQFDEGLPRFFRFNKERLVPPSRGAQSLLGR